MSDRNEKELACKAILALDFLKSFWVSDVSDELKNEAKKVLLEYLRQRP